nr:hypothetical protein [Paenibacillus forsythiae]
MLEDRMSISPEHPYAGYMSIGSIDLFVDEVLFFEKQLVFDGVLVELHV